MNLSITNADFGDLFVTVLDLNTANATALLNNARINEGQSVEVYPQANGQDEARIRWTATRTDGTGTSQTADVTASVGDQVNVSSS